ncbi:MAG: DUF3195 domain-containing protein [Pyrobaculum sp.]
MWRLYVLIKTLPKKGHIVARDLCDCIYYHDVEVKCEVLSPERFFVYTHMEGLEKCINMKYFSKVIKGLEYFDEVSLERPRCSNCVVVEIGGRFFVRWV